MISFFLPLAGVRRQHRRRRGGSGGHRLSLMRQARPFGRPMQGILETGHRGDAVKRAGNPVSPAPRPGVRRAIQVHADRRPAAPGGGRAGARRHVAAFVAAMRVPGSPSGGRRRAPAHPAAVLRHAAAGQRRGSASRSAAASSEGSPRWPSARVAAAWAPKSMRARSPSSAICTDTGPISAGFRCSSACCTPSLASRLISTPKAVANRAIRAAPAPSPLRRRRRRSGWPAAQRCLHAARSRRWQWEAGAGGGLDRGAGGLAALAPAHCLRRAPRWPACARGRPSRRRCARPEPWLARPSAGACSHPAPAPGPGAPWVVLTARRRRARRARVSSPRTVSAVAVSAGGRCRCASHCASAGSTPGRRLGRVAGLCPVRAPPCRHRRPRGAPPAFAGCARGSRRAPGGSWPASASSPSCAACPSLAAFGRRLQGHQLREVAFAGTCRLGAPGWAGRRQGCRLLTCAMGRCMAVSETGGGGGQAVPGGARGEFVERALLAARRALDLGDAALDQF